MGEGDRTRPLCHHLNVQVVGIHTWRHAMGVEQLKINDHYTVPSGPEGLLPKNLRPGE